MDQCSQKPYRVRRLTDEPNQKEALAFASLAAGIEHVLEKQNIDVPWSVYNAETESTEVIVYWDQVFMKIDDTPDANLPQKAEALRLAARRALQYIYRNIPIGHPDVDMVNDLRLAIGLIEGNAEVYREYPGDFSKPEKGGVTR
ncbi:MAG: hypothetical protein KJ077_11145 [Anaerolineae bacterium]|nr:hypothetical protein [Anaerolineae bacterium]